MNIKTARKLFTISIVVLISFSFMPVERQPVGKITFPLGNVLILSEGETRFRKATYNLPVVNGDKVETKKQSRCEITYNDGSIVRVDEQTLYTVERANMDKDQTVVESKLSIGKLWANIKKLVKGRDSWKLKSPAAVVAVRGTIYRMNAGADSSTQVLVYDGNVEVSPAQTGAEQGGMGAVPGKPRQVQGPVQVQGPTQVSLGQWLEIVRAQQQIVIRPDGSYAKSDFNLQEDAKLEWVQWNQQRDELLK
jgi:hypothetical protein